MNKKMMMEQYEAPKFEVVLLEVEQGFVGSESWTGDGDDYEQM